MTLMLRLLKHILAGYKDAINKKDMIDPICFERHKIIDIFVSGKMLKKNMRFGIILPYKIQKL